MDLTTLAAKWADEAELLRKYGDERTAEVTLMHALELKRALSDTGREELTLTEASRESGYAERTLRQMIADGTVPNVGRRHRPRIRRADLPRKPGSSATVDALAADFLQRSR